MAEAAVALMNETETESGLSRIYEIGYLIAQSVKDEDVEKVVAEIRKQIETVHGSFIAEGAPSMTRLAYAIDGIEAGKHVNNDRAYFGWLKFEAPSDAAATLEEFLKRNTSIIRHIVFRTVREETRAHLKAPQLREVRRTDTIKSTPKRVEEVSAPVSEAQLDKALEDITAE
jgi:ribosomal protein S6